MFSNIIVIPVDRCSFELIVRQIIRYSEMKLGEEIIKILNFVPYDYRISIVREFEMNSYFIRYNIIVQFLAR